MNGRTVSIIIPTYNEAPHVAACLQAVVNASTAGFAKEIIIVDDGSTDATPQIIRQFIASCGQGSATPEPRVITSAHNQGKGAAVKRGLLASMGEIVIIQDADLEYDTSDYPALLEPFVRFGADAVYGSRFISPRPHRVLYFWHAIGNRIITLFSNLCTNLNLTDMETGYKAFRGDLIRRLAPALESPRFGFEPEITARLAKIPGINMYEVGISYRGRTYADGKKIRWTDGLRAIGEIIKFNLLSS